MLYFTYTEDQEGFIDWIRSIPKIRTIVRMFLNYRSEEVRSWHREEYLQANKIYRDYLLFMNLSSEDEVIVLNEIITKKTNYIPKDHIAIYYRWIKTIYKKSKFKPSNISSKEIGDEIKRARTEKDLSRVYVAKLIGVSAASLKFYEDGKRKIPFEIYYKLKQIFTFTF